MIHKRASIKYRCVVVPDPVGLPPLGPLVATVLVQQKSASIGTVPYPTKVVTTGLKLEVCWIH
jgi:hypothetical protein